MKMRVVLIVLFLINITCCYADPAQQTTQQNAILITQPQNINFENCSKMFAVNKEKLLYLTMGAVNANRFAIEEIQTSDGYIIFTAAGNKYLATISGIDASNSILRITPCNDIYYFQPGIILGMFKYVGMNINTEIR